MQKNETHTTNAACYDALKDTIGSTPFDKKGILSQYLTDFNEAAPKVKHATAKLAAVKMGAKLGDLPTVRRKGRFKITPPEVYDYNDFDSKTTKRILKKIADKQDYFLKKWHETHKKK